MEGQEEIVEVKTGPGRQEPQFQFNWEVDPEQDIFESFELPEIFLGRYMHDFKVKIIVL